MFEESAFLQAAVKIGRWGAKLRREDVLLEAVADAFHEDFGLYAVQVYLIEAAKQTGELRYFGVDGSRVAGDGPPVTVQVGHGSELGTVLGGGEAIVLRGVESLAAGTTLAALLAGGSSLAALIELESVVALPLKVDEDAIGALVLGASETDVFEDSVVERFVVLADLFALAIRSVQAAGRSAAQIAAGGEGVSATRFERDTLDKISYSVGATLGDETSDRAHSAPISLRGKRIGTMSFRGGDEQALDADKLELIDSVAEQVAQAVDHISLLDGVQSAELREQLVGDIMAQLQAEHTVEGVLQATAKAVRGALGNVEVRVRLSPEETAKLDRGETADTK